MKSIVEITDEMFGMKSKEFDNPRVRYGARGIIEREDGYIAILNKQVKNEYKLPGGGIDKGETPEEAFVREVLEEAGCEIENVECLGTTEELKSLDNFKQLSYVFTAKVVKINDELNLTEKEKAEGARLLWMSKEEALEKITNCANDLKASEYEDIYHSLFINYRDREILKYYIENV